MSAITTSTIAQKLFKLPHPPEVSSDRANWDSVQLALFKQPPHCIPEHVAPCHVICINAGAPVMLEQTINGETLSGQSVPSDISLYPAHLWQTFEWHQEASFLQLYLEPVLLNQIGSELSKRDTVELLPQSLPADPMISQIAIALQNTLKKQTPAVSSTPTLWPLP